MPFEMLAEAGGIAVADATGDAGHGQLGGGEQFGGFFQAELLQVGLKADAVVLAEEAAEIACAGKGHLPRHVRQLQW